MTHPKELWDVQMSNHSDPFEGEIAAHAYIRALQRILALEAALRACWDGWAKGDDLVTPMHNARALLHDSQPKHEESGG